jgi:hypothetical protein
MGTLPGTQCESPARRKSVYAWPCEVDVPPRGGRADKDAAAGSPRIPAAAPSRPLLLLCSTQCERLAQRVQHAKCH